MTYSIILHADFHADTKTLQKRFPKIQTDIKKAISCLLSDPCAGVVVPKYGGLRKLRLKNSDAKKGKSGGYRLIYRFDPALSLVELLAIYSKSDSQALTHVELTELLQG